MATGVACTIGYDFIKAKMEKMVCEATGWPLEIDGPPFAFNKPSLDRVSWKGDYSPDNTRLVCWGVNNMLGRYGEEKLLDVATAIESRRSSESRQVG